MVKMTNGQLKSAIIAQTQSMYHLLDQLGGISVKRVNDEHFKFYCAESNELIGRFHGIIDREKWAIHIEFIPDAGKKSYLNYPLLAVIDDIWDTTEAEERQVKFTAFLQKIKDSIL